MTESGPLGPPSLHDPGLDNWVWASLVGVHAALGQRHRSAARFHPDISPFAALDDQAGPDAWNDLATLAGAGGETVVFRAVIDAPQGWVTTWSADARQMMLPTPEALGSPGVIDGVTVRPLGPGDVDAMLDLTQRTRPGPFLRRTIELGTYLGAFAGSSLAAMAGERCRWPGWTEISAVCTDPDHQGRGLAAELVRRVAGGIFAGGARPVLHVAADNVAAIRVYERLGFVDVAPVSVAALIAPAADGSASGASDEPSW